MEHSMGSASVSKTWNKMSNLKKMCDRQSIPVCCAAASALVTVLMTWRSWNRATPSGSWRSDVGRFSLSRPVMVIRGSEGCSTITTASMSRMLMQVSSPKHLERGREEIGLRLSNQTRCRFKVTDTSTQLGLASDPALMSAKSLLSHLTYSVIREVLMQVRSRLGFILLKRTRFQSYKVISLFN